MLTIQSSLQPMIDKFLFQLSGAYAWAPYWINLDEPPYRLDAPLRGKGSPAEITAELKRVLSHGGHDVSSPDELRALMREFGLGIDCSGFVYHVLDGWLQSEGITLADHLLVPGTDVQTYLANHPKLATPEGFRGGSVPVSVVCAAWNKKPADHVNVARLVSPLSSVRVYGVGNIRPGDMIKQTTPFGDHIGIVSDIQPHQLVYWSADDPGTGLGGVTLHTFELSDPGASLDRQRMKFPHYRPAQHGDGVYRLKVLAAD